MKLVRNLLFHGVHTRGIDVDVDVEEFWAQTIVSMPVLNTQITIIIS